MRLVPMASGLTLLLACQACTTGGGSSAQASKRGGRQPVYPVEVVRVEAKPHELLVSAPGVIDAFEHIQVTARVSGVVDKITFREGQEIKRGEALAYIDSRRYALGVSSAKAALAKAEATEADAQQSLKRRQSASETNPGLIAGEEVETYQTKLRTAQADVDSAREALKLAALNLSDSDVRAQVEGVIQTRSVETGQYVQAGTVIATLLQRDPMLLRFDVTTAEAPRLKVGMPVEFTLKESQQVYTATISLVAGAADAESRLVPVTAQVQSDHKFWLRPGSFAQVSIKLMSQRQFPMIPQAAARPSDHGFLAYVVQGTVAHERTLQIGLHTTDGMVEVRQGLSAGDLLVTRGVEALTDGCKVTVASGAPASSGSAEAPNAPAASGSTAENTAPHRRRGDPAAAQSAGAP